MREQESAGSAHGAARLRICAAEDVLSFVPHLLGFAPALSLVLLALRGRQLGAAVRIDLPQGAAEAEYLRRVVALLREDPEADAMLMVLYAPEALTDPGGVFESLPSRLAEQARCAGLPVQDGWTVGTAYWRSCFCEDSGCCPRPGRPTASLASAPLGAELVFRGSVAAGSVGEAIRRDLAEAAGRLQDPDGPSEPLPGPGTRARTGSGQQFPPAATAVRRAALFRGWWQHAVVLPHILGAWETALRRAGEGQAPTDAAAGLLAGSLTSRTVRDLLPVQAAAGLGPALAGARAAGLLADGPVPAHVLRNLPVLPTEVRRDLQQHLLPGHRERHPAGEAAPEGSPAEPTRLLADILTGQWTGGPDWPRLDSAFCLLAWLTGRTAEQGAPVPGAARPGPAGTLDPAPGTLLAWIEWARGRGSRAQLLLDQVLATEPDYRLAVLMAELFAGGSVPRWATAAATAWSGRESRG